MFVVDASVSMAWCFEDETSVVTEQVLDTLAGEGALVPSVWPLEVANVLLGAERSGRLSAAQGVRFVELLGQLPIAVDPAPPGVAALLEAGRRHHLTSYDAAYVLLAEREGFPIATLDAALARAAAAAGIRLLIS